MEKPVDGGLEFRSQEELLRAAHDGNGQAFADFCVRILPGLIRYLQLHCRQMGVPVDMARDFAQGTLLRAISHIKTYDPNGFHPPPRVSAAWLYQIGYHLIVDWTRANERYHKALPELQRTHGSKPTRDQQEQHEEVLKFSAWLTSNEKEMVELVLMKGMHPLEAGKEMGLSKDAAYKTYQRALVHLRDLIQEHGTLSVQSFSR